MKYVFASLCALLISLACFSQKEKSKEYVLVDFSAWDSLSGSDHSRLDSLLPLYHSAKNDTTRFSILNALTELLNEERLWTQYNLIVHDQTNAVLHSGKKLPAKEERAVKKYYASSLQTLGYYQENTMGNLAKALEYYKEARKIQEEIQDLRGLGFTINNMAIVFQHEGNIPKSLEYYMEALKIAESINEKQPIGYALNNLGTLYLLQGDTATALEYQDRALKIRQEIGDKQGVIYSLGNLGSLYQAKGDFEKALHYYHECFRISQENGQKQGMGYSQQHIGSIYQVLWEQKYKDQVGQPDTLFQRSMECFNKSLALVEELGDKRGITFAVFGIGKLYFKLNDLTKATSYADRSLKLAQEIGYPTLIRNAAELLYKIYKQEGKPKEALAMHEIHILMRDSLLNEETKKSLFRQKTKYEYEKQKALNDAENQKAMDLADEGKKRQQIISYSIGFGLLLLAAFSIFIFNRLKLTRTQKQVIEEQKQTVEKKNTHILESMSYAKRIQDSILPTREELHKCLPQHFIFFQPREIVSGDFYWVSEQGGKTILAVADCTGHGVPGAFMSMIGNTLLNEIVNEQKIIQPAEILNHLNEGILHTLHRESQTQEDGMDISVCLFDHNSNKVLFAGANHSLLVGNGSSLVKYDGDLQSIGSMFNPGPTRGIKSVSFTQKEIVVEKGCSVFISTDGFADQPGGEKGKKFTTRKFEQLLREIAPLPVQEQEKAASKAFEEWKNTKQQIDDVLLIGIKM